MDIPLVSIIVPTKNRIHYLKQAIRSAQLQAYKEIELIIVDDCSEDGTIEYLDSLIEGYLIIYNQESLGPSIARNMGVEASNGEYILFLDDDDLLAPNHIADLVNYVQKFDSKSIISSRWRSFKQNNNGSINIYPVNYITGIKKFNNAVADMIDPQVQDNIWTSSLLFPKSVFNKCKWSPDLFTNGDIDFFANVLLNGYSLRGVNSGMAYYRKHAGDRVAGTPSLKGLLSSSKHKIKWSNILHSEFKNDPRIGKALLNSTMSLMLSWQLVPDNQKEDKILNELREIFYQWGGTRYFLPNNKSRIKKIGVEILLNTIGLKVWKHLYSLKRGDIQNGYKDFRCGAVDENDVEDLEIIKSLIKSIDE